MPIFKNLIGNTYHRLQVISLSDKNNCNKVHWNCQCSCGNLIIVAACHLISGHTQSCGCFKKEVLTKHGESFKKEHWIWKGIVRRCTVPKCKHYHNYGGRGIKVDNRWLVYENFLTDMGRAPSSDHTVERKDNNGDYNLDNCKWATWDEQANNRRSNRFVSFNGETLTISQWAQKTNIAGDTIIGRLNRGWTDERALTQSPLEHRNGKKKRNFNKKEYNERRKLERGLSKNNRNT